MSINFFWKKKKNIEFSDDLLPFSCHEHIKSWNSSQVHIFLCCCLDNRGIWFIVPITGRDELVVKRGCEWAVHLRGWPLVHMDFESVNLFSYPTVYEANFCCKCVAMVPWAKEPKKASNSKHWHPASYRIRLGGQLSNCCFCPFRCSRSIRSSITALRAWT